MEFFEWYNLFKGHSIEVDPTTRVLSIYDSEGNKVAEAVISNRIKGDITKIDYKKAASKVGDIIYEVYLKGHDGKNWVYASDVKMIL